MTQGHVSCFKREMGKAIPLGSIFRVLKNSALLRSLNLSFIHISFSSYVFIKNSISSCKSCWSSQSSYLAYAWSSSQCFFLNVIRVIHSIARYSCLMLCAMGLGFFFPLSAPPLRHFMTQPQLTSLFCLLIYKDAVFLGMKYKER